LATSGENPKSPAQVEEEYQHSTINYVGLWLPIKWSLKIIRRYSGRIKKACASRYGLLWQYELGVVTWWLVSVDGLLKDEQRNDQTYRRLVTEKCLSGLRPVQKKEKSKCRRVCKMNEEHQHHHH
jgi:hypothetical protein